MFRNDLYLKEFPRYYVQHLMFSFYFISVEIRTEYSNRDNSISIFIVAFFILAFLILVTV